MGLTVTRMAIRSGLSGPIGRAIDAAVAYRVIALAEPWAVLDVVPREESFRLINLAETMQEVTAEFDQPSLIAHVEDSDCSLVVALRPSVEPVLVVFNGNVARDCGVIADIVNRIAWDGPRFAEWASSVGLPSLDPEEVTRTVQQDWTHAEDPIELIGKRLGLALLARPSHADLEGLLEIHDSRTRIGRIDYTTTETRYAWGRGDGFYGVWDRLHPGPPIEVFPGDPTGFRLANQEYKRMIFDLPEEDRML